MSRTLSAAIAVAVALCAGAGCGGSDEVDNTALRERMQYLANLDEVEWLDFQGGEVYVGFRERPPDLGITMASAVTAASKAHGNRKVRVVAVDGAKNDPAPYADIRALLVDTMGAGEEGPPHVQRRA